MHRRILVLPALLLLMPALALAPADATTPLTLRLALADFSTPGGPGATPTSITTGVSGVSAFDLAKAMEGTPGIVKAARFLEAPQPWAYGISTTSLTTFPEVGDSFAILSTGDASYAELDDSSGSTSSNNGGGNVRGNTDYDVVILEVEIAAPRAHTVNCISIDFRFLSEEYPEWVGSIFNDATIGEPGFSSWTTQDSAITAPNNFMFSNPNQLVSINGAGQFDMTAAAASDTTYDGATPHYRAYTPIPAPVMVNNEPRYLVYISIFDQGDQIYDSSVFLDNLQLFTSATCVRGPAEVWKS